MTAGSRSGAKHSLDTCLEKQTCFQPTGGKGNQNRSKIHTIHQQNDEDTKSGACAESETNLHGEFYPTSYTATAREDHSLLTFLPLHTSHPFLLSNTTFSRNDFLIKHLKQF